MRFPVYPAGRLLEEVGVIARAFGWSLDDLLDLTHRDRHDLLDVAVRMATRTGDRRA